MTHEFLTTTLLDVLPQEVYGPMHINGADKGDQLEIQLLSRERE